ncbi:MAG: acetolactate synthase [Oscillospiraceae bacterium]|jgi:hypothetical protein|nr:acetolactate synthase [Oscillospiraceae bacterium]
MAIEQVSVFIENQPGRLYEILSFLAEEEIDLRSYSVAETSDFGILRMIVHDTEGAVAALKRKGFTARRNDVLGIVIPDATGSAVQAIRLLSDAGINIEYTYAFVMPNGRPQPPADALPPERTAFVLLRVEDNARAEALLSAAGVKLAEHRELF